LNPYRTQTVAVAHKAFNAACISAVIAVAVLFNSVYIVELLLIQNLMSKCHRYSGFKNVENYDRRCMHCTEAI